MEDKYLNKNGFNYPKNTVGKAILWALYPIGVYLGASIIVGFIFAFITIFKIILSGQELIIEDYINSVYSSTGLILVLQQIISLAAVLPIFLVHRKHLPKPEKKNTFSSFVLGVLFALGCCAVVSILQNLLFSLFSTNDSLWDQTQGMITSISLPLQIISVVVLAPIVEELMFRGMIMNRLMSVFPKWVAVAVSALAFGIIHLNLTQGIFAALIGLVFGVLYLKTRSILLCMLAHAANNLWATLASLIDWSSDLHAFLAEGALAIVSLVAVIIAVFVKRNKGRTI